MSSAKPLVPYVALLIETSNAYARNLLAGINQYAEAHGPWSFYLPERSRGEVIQSWLRNWKIQGVLARIETKAMAELLSGLRVPAVNLSKSRITTSFACVETDDASVARLAFDHLFERGIRHFAFCPEEDFLWSQMRADSFLELARAAGATASLYQRPRTAQRRWSFEQQQDHLGLWLKQLPKPVGLMAAYDIRGRQVLDACRRIRIHVPDEVAVIGVDNDELLCSLAHPSLSSVDPDARRIGYEAAALLDQAMAGKKASGQTLLIGPSRIATRQSTDVLATDDREVAQAVRFIRLHACEGIKVKDILQEIPVARRSLEVRFAKVVGRSLHAEIARKQLERAKELLSSTDLAMETVAQKSGFRHLEYMSVAFKKATGLTPGRYRKGQSAS